MDTASSPVTQLQEPKPTSRKIFHAYVGFEMSHETAINWLARIRNCEPENLTKGEIQIAPIHLWRVTERKGWRVYPIGPPRTYFPDGRESIDQTHCILATRRIRFVGHEGMTEAEVQYVPDAREERAKNFLQAQGLSPSEYQFKWKLIPL